MNCNQLARPDSSNPQATPLDFVRKTLADPAIRKAITKGASIAVGARKLPSIQVGTKSLPLALDDKVYRHEPITLQQAYVADAIQATYLELLANGNPERLAAFTNKKDLIKAVAELDMKCANKLLYQSKREVRLEAPSTDDGGEEPVTAACDDISLKKGDWDPVLGKCQHHSVRRADWVAANAVENDLIEKLDREPTARSETAETEYERCLRILGPKNATWYWDYKESLYRHPHSPAERARFYRLRVKLK